MEKMNHLQQKEKYIWKCLSGERYKDEAQVKTETWSLAFCLMFWLKITSNRFCSLQEPHERWHRLLKLQLQTRYAVQLAVLAVQLVVEEIVAVIASKVVGCCPAARYWVAWHASAAAAHAVVSHRSRAHRWLPRGQRCILLLALPSR